MRASSLRSLFLATAAALPALWRSAALLLLSLAARHVVCSARRRVSSGVRKRLAVGNNEISHCLPRTCFTVILHSQPQFGGEGRRVEVARAARNCPGMVGMVSGNAARRAGE